MADDGPPLTLQVTEEIRIQTDVDMVKFYTELSEAGRDEYKELDPDDFTDPGEYHWPVEFLIGDRDDLAADAAGSVRYGPGVREMADHDHVDLHVRRRPHRAGSWSEADFNLLLSKVPWLAAFHAARDVTGGGVCSCGELIRLDGNGWVHLTGGWVSDHPVEPREPTIEDLIRAKHGRNW